MKRLCEGSQLSSIARTDSGPLTDGRSKRKKPAEDTQRTFNDNFCKEYFESEEVRRSWHMYIDLMFCQTSCNGLSEKLGILCCDEEDHSIECENKWSMMKEYLQFGMLESLGISAVDWEDCLEWHF